MSTTSSTPKLDAIAAASPNRASAQARTSSAEARASDGGRVGWTGMTSSCDQKPQGPRPGGRAFDEFASNRISAYAQSSGSSPRHRDAQAQTQQQAAAVGAWVGGRRAIDVGLSVGGAEVKRCSVTAA